MPSQEEIYRTAGDAYEALIRREDYQGNILRALEDLVPLAYRIVLDLGAGTGRLTRLLVPRVRFVRAFDESEEMLRVCRETTSALGFVNWSAQVADHRRLPIEDHSAYLAVSGWSVSYLAVREPENWRAPLEEWLTEMKRVLRPGSPIILFETLGTGHESPFRVPHLLDFYAWLEGQGFESTWIRTDYKFESQDEAESLTRFFFGNDLADEVRGKSWVILPECTGVWWLKV